MIIEIADGGDALRILSGVWFIPHIISKLLNADKAWLTFDKVGFRPGKFFLYLTVVMEVLACIGLVFNLFPKIAALLATGVLVGAAYAVYKMNGLKWRWQLQGQEFLAFWVLVCLVSVLY